MFLNKIIGECWDTVLINVGNLDDKYLRKKKAQPCPNCGGTDRFEYHGVNKRSSLYDGSYLCRGCGAGDGFSLLIKLLNQDYSAVKKRVMKFLNIEDHSSEYIDFNNLTPEMVTQGLTRDGVNKHPYMKSKKLNIDELSIEDVGLYKGRLAIPIYNMDGSIATYELISTDGKKLSLKGRPRVNCLYRIGGVAVKRIYLCEGFSTALSLHYLTGEPCICSFGSMNLINIFIELVKAEYKDPTPKIVVACDNDPAGMKVAYDVRSLCVREELFNISCIIPKKENTDFSDLYVANSDKSITNLLDDITILFRL